MKLKLPYILLAIYLLVFLACGLDPYDRAVWWAENLPIVILVAIVAWLHRNHQFSHTSYFFMAFLIILHTIGGHYTFERVPFDWVTDYFNFERNHYDRLAHFSVGFYAFPIAEILLRGKRVQSPFIILTYPILAIVTLAGVYEIFEWQYAVSADEEAGIAVLGSQGDIWDAQKDILADTLGSIFAITIFYYRYHRNLKQLNS